MSMSVVTQRQSIPWNSSMVTLKLLLDRIGGSETVKIIEEDKKLRAFQCIDLTVEGKIIIMEWQATPVNDMYADTVLASIMQTEMGGTNIKGTATQMKSDQTHFRECLLETLKDTFGDSSVPKLFEGDQLTVTVVGKTVDINLETLVSSNYSILISFFIYLWLEISCLNIIMNSDLQAVTSKDDDNLRHIVHTTVQNLYQALVAIA